MAISNKDRQQWQAEDDARVMAQYQEIMSDRFRMNRAIKEANKQASDLSKRATAMKNAATIKLSVSKGKKK